MREVQLVGPAYADESLTFSAQDTVNWIPVMDESGQARSNMQLRGLPGLIDLGAEIGVTPLIIVGNGPDGFEGEAYSTQYFASFGSPPYTYAIFFGLLPLGLTLDAETGELSGTLTRAGEYNFTIEAIDSAGGRASINDTIIVLKEGDEPVDPPETVPAPLVNGDFESGDVEWFVSNIPFGGTTTGLGPGDSFEILNEEGRGGSAWVCRYTCGGTGAECTFTNETVVFNVSGARVTGEFYARCTSITQGEGKEVYVGVLMEGFSDELLTNRTGVAVRSFLRFSEVLTWRQLTSYISGVRYIRLSIYVAGNTPAVIEFDDASWDAEEEAP